MTGAISFQWNGEPSGGSVSAIPAMPLTEWLAPRLIRKGKLRAGGRFVLWLVGTIATLEVAWKTRSWTTRVTREEKQILRAIRSGKQEAYQGPMQSLHNALFAEVSEHKRSWLRPMFEWKPSSDDLRKAEGEA